MRALLLDRDGTLVEDVPYNADPAAVRPLPGVAEALALARSSGLVLAVVTNQSGIARGRIHPAELRAVHVRLSQLLGPFDVIVWCPHGPWEGCACRKPAPGLVLRAAGALGVAPDECVVVGDRADDVAAARAAGALGIRIGTRAVPDLLAAVHQLVTVPGVASAQDQHQDHDEDDDADADVHVRAPWRLIRRFVNVPRPWCRPS